MRIKKVKKGLTLLEVIIAMAILLIIVSPVLSLTLSTTKITKKSDDKLKAMAIAQEYMENIKNNDTTDTLGEKEKSENFSEEGFKIIQTTKPMTNYSFKDIEEDSNDIAYDVEITVSESGSIDFRSKEGISVSQDLSKNTLNITNSNENKEITIKIDSKWDKILKLNITNKVYDKDLKIYLFKDSNSEGDYSVKSSIGKVKIYSNMFNDTQTNSSKYRLYKITVKVNKNEKELQNIEGYKTFLK